MGAKRRAGWMICGALMTAALAATLVIGEAYRRDMAHATARLQGRSVVVRSPWGPIEYATIGQGPPVLVIHGSGGGFDQGLEMMGPLAAHGFRLIAPSRFGYLRSARPANASPQVQADALAWLVARLGEQQVVVAGGSAGALTAMQFAIRHPQMTRAVVLIVPAAYAPDRLAGQNAMGGSLAEWLTLCLLRSDFAFWAVSRLYPAQMTRAVLATDPALVTGAAPEERARVRSVLTYILPVSRRAQGLADDTRWAGSPAPYRLDRITAPLLAVSAADDLYGTYASARFAAAGARDGTFVGYPSGGHVLVGRQTQMWDEVARWLAALERR